MINFNHKYSDKIKKLHCKISADAQVIQSYASKVQNKAVLREALRVLHLKQFAKRGPNILGKFLILLNTSDFLFIKIC